MKRRTLSRFGAHPGARRGRLLEAFGRALLQRRDMAAESHIGGQAEKPIDPVRPTPVEHFRGRIAEGRWSPRVETLPVYDSPLPEFARSR